MTDLAERIDAYHSEDPQQIITRACLVMCLRRLRESENNHLLSRDGYASLYERQQAEEQAGIDRNLIEMIEGILLANPAPEPP